MITSLIGTIKKTFTFKGRATKAEFWYFVLAAVIVSIILGVLTAVGSAIHHVVGIIFAILSLIVYIAMTICYISVSVRRLHDLGLSGFWLWYLNPFGLLVVYMVYLLDLDSACNQVIQKIQKTGSTWLGWILAWLFWPVGAFACLFLLFLSKGKNEAIEFGPSPYAG